VEALKPIFHWANLFTRTKKKQIDWLAIKTDAFTLQSHSLFLVQKVENGLKLLKL
jgi:hypothetical protein